MEDLNLYEGDTEIEKCGDYSGRCGVMAVIRQAEMGEKKLFAQKTDKDI